MRDHPGARVCALAALGLTVVVLQSAGGGPAAAQTEAPAVASPTGAGAAPAAPAVPAARAARSDRPVADARWCGIETEPAPPEPASLCKLTSLPCGPVGSDQIHRGSGEVTEDLDGDGRPDLTVGGRRDTSRPEMFAAIYRATEAGFVLSDYRTLPPHTEPSFASVVLARPGAAPLVRDGYDLVESGGRSLTVARLRRFDGQRFRTLLTFCAHRVEPGAPAREGHNRADLIDVDKDGSKELVVQGLLRPLVYRFTDSGLGLVEDPELTRRYRDSSPEIARSRALRTEAGKLLEGGQTRRAAEALLRAFQLTPHDVDLGLEGIAGFLGAGQPERALDLVHRLSFLAPERTAVRCAAAGVHRALGDTSSELAALRTCATEEPDETLRGTAASRLRELQPPPPAPAAPAPDPLPPPPPA